MRSNSVMLWGGTAGLFVAVVATGRQELIGAILGYWLGFVNSAWLNRDAKRSVDMELRRALARMRRSFFVRMALLTTVIIVVGRLEKGWLLDLACGIAAGVIVSLISYMRRQFVSGKG